VALLKSYAVGTANVLAKVQLGRQDGWKSIGHGEGREISVLSASLRGVVKHHGLRYVLLLFMCVTGTHPFFFGLVVFSHASLDLSRSCRPWYSSV
jgi:hypothetical protein